jgi:hypothetical protein
MTRIIRLIRVSTNSLDGLLLLAALLFALSLATLWWPSVAFIGLMSALGCLAVTAILAFIVIPIVVDHEDGD